jgi:tetratricopeptide (TPR) repeat protein
MVAYGLHEPQVALEIIDSGLMVDPLSADLYAQQGNVFDQMERYESARDAFLKAVELDPLNPNHYSRMAFVSGELGDITAAFQWRLKNIEADPQDHESIGHMARDFYEWGLPEEGDRWMNAVRVLAPNSDILQRLQVERALSRGDTDELIAVAQKMIAAPASMRQNAFPTALFSYRQQMSKAGRSREAYDFLAGLRPEITSFEQLPDDLHGTLMQWASIELMSGFRSPEERKADWEKFTENLRMKGPWWFEEPNAQATNFLFIGDLDSAIEKAQEDLAQPLSSWPTRAEAWDGPMFAPITANPQIAARLSEMKREKQQARAQIREMLQGPEWNQ